MLEGGGIRMLLLSFFFFSCPLSSTITHDNQKTKTQPPLRGPGQALPRVSVRGRGPYQALRVREALGESIFSET